MKVVIFAGGFGTRLMEETDSRPKPMVEIEVSQFYGIYLKCMNFMGIKIL